MWLSRSDQELWQASVDMDYMHRVLHTAPRGALVDTSPRVSLGEVLPPCGSKLELRDVWFSYDRAEDRGDSPRYLLRGLNFTVHNGQSVAIVGSSGSGENIILRNTFCDSHENSVCGREVHCSEVDNGAHAPHRGAIFLDDVDVAAADSVSVRKRVAVITQDTNLFASSVLHNVQYGSPQASEAEVWAAIRACQLIDTVARWPEGLLTAAGERGVRLSGGERQKVAIARFDGTVISGGAALSDKGFLVFCRAILRRPSLLLCDEVTSSVDAAAERDILHSLRHAAEHRTTVTVAHRLSTIAHCDAILVLKGGTVVEQGTHAQLMAIPAGVYRQMWDTQHGGLSGSLWSEVT